MSYDLRCEPVIPKKIIILDNLTEPHYRRKCLELR